MQRRFCEQPRFLLRLHCGGFGYGRGRDGISEGLLSTSGHGLITSSTIRISIYPTQHIVFIRMVATQTKVQRKIVSASCLNGHGHRFIAGLLGGERHAEDLLAFPELGQLVSGHEEPLDAVFSDNAHADYTTGRAVS